MSDTIETTYGSCIDLVVEHLANGEPVDVSGDMFEIRDAVPSSLESDFVIAPVIGDPHKISLHLDSDSARKLGFGRVNHFRLVRVDADGCEDSTRKLWIDVK